MIRSPKLVAQYRALEGEADVSCCADSGIPVPFVPKCGGRIERPSPEWCQSRMGMVPVTPFRHCD